MSDPLADAARDRLLMLLLEPPSAVRPAALRELLPSLSEPFATATDRLAEMSVAEVEADYHRLLGPTGAVPFCESDLGANAFAKGRLISDVSGFYKAFRYPETAEVLDSPDHIAVELGFAAYLAIKQVYAEFLGEPEHVATAIEAREAFGRDHLDPFAGRLASRLAEVAPEDSYYAGVAALLAARAVHAG